MHDGRVYRSREVRRHQRRVIAGYIVRALAMVTLLLGAMVMAWLALWAAYHGGA